MTRLAATSPVATRHRPPDSSVTARAMRACPSTSSACVGSSIQYGSTSTSTAIAAIASSTSQTWLASIISNASGPISARMIRARRRSSSSRPPTFIFIARQPRAYASRVSARTCSSG